MDIKKVTEKRTAYDTVLFRPSKANEDPAVYIAEIMAIARWCQGAIVVQYGVDPVIEINKGGAKLTVHPGDWIIDKGSVAMGSGGRDFRKMSPEAFQRDLEEV